MVQAFDGTIAEDQGLTYALLNALVAGHAPLERDIYKIKEYLKIHSIDDVLSRTADELQAILLILEKYNFAVSAQCSTNVKYAIENNIIAKEYKSSFLIRHQTSQELLYNKRHTFETKQALISIYFGLIKPEHNLYGFVPRIFTKDSVWSNDGIGKVFNEGDYLLYTNSEGKLEKCHVDKVHTDSAPVYYTISFVDLRTVQTVGERLSPMPSV
jgi:hypothetical protein